MNKKEEVCRAVKRIGWGYVFLYFNINLGTINILPAFWGYCLFYKGIRDGISLEEESADLLKPIAILLGIYQGILWLLACFGIPMDVLLISELASVISLYFHFQLLTNLANISKKYHCSQEKSLLHVRTIQTIVLTILAFTTPFEEMYILSIVLVIVQIVMIICLCIILRDFKHTLEIVPDIDFEDRVC